MIKRLITVLLVTTLIFTISCVSLRSDGNKVEKDNFLKEYHGIPTELKDKAKVAFLGEYWRGRSPCVPRPNGLRAWFLTAGFKIKQDFIGNIKVKSIGVNSSVELIQGANYIVLLNPRKDTMKIIETKDKIFAYFDAVSHEEIIKTFEVK